MLPRWDAPFIEYRQPFYKYRYSVHLFVAASRKKNHAIKNWQGKWRGREETWAGRFKEEGERETKVRIIKGEDFDLQARQGIS